MSEYKYIYIYIYIYMYIYIYHFSVGFHCIERNIYKAVSLALLRIGPPHHAGI